MLIGHWFQCVCDIVRVNGIEILLLREKVKARLPVRYPVQRHVFHHEKHTYISFDPLKPHFYIVKLGFTGHSLFFLFLLKNIDCGYSLEPPRRGGSNEYPQSMF